MKHLWSLPALWQACVVADQPWSPERPRGSWRAAVGLKMCGCHGPGLPGNHGDDAGHSARLQSSRQLLPMKRYLSLSINPLCVVAVVDESELDSQETSTTVAGAVWVSAKRRRLWRSLSSAAFLAVALICATVTWWSNKICIHSFTF